MKTDQELLETFDLTFEEPDIQILTVKASTTTKEDAIRQAQLIEKAYEKMEDEHPGISFRNLSDLRQTHSTGPMPAEARDIFMKSAQKVRKGAIVGNNLLLEAAVNLIAQAMGKGQSIRWFKDIEEARAWLKED
jgi:hypothetical protein